MDKVALLHVSESDILWPVSVWGEVDAHAATGKVILAGSGPPLGSVPGQAWFGCCSHAFTYIGMSYAALPACQPSSFACLSRARHFPQRPCSLETNLVLGR
jgi:hypothetical protein